MKVASLFQLRPKQASMVWLESNRVHAGGNTYPLDGIPDPSQLAPLLAKLPLGPTKWVVDDLWTPSILLKDIVELPSGVEARESFFQWRYSQSLAIEETQSVHSLDLGEGTWLLAGMSLERREGWIQMALQTGRPIHALLPRWLWIYNRLAPVQDLPGMLLSLDPDGEGGYTGTLAAWGRTLCLLRQWSNPASAEEWMGERVIPSLAFLQRESKSPQQLWIWGASDWPDGPLMNRILQPEIPAQEGF
jgi:hypothetical protein